MDDRLTKALEYSNYKVIVFQQKQNLKLRLENLLTYAHNGGMFKITQELISFVAALLQREVTEVVLVDSRENPVKIDNLEDFYDTILSQYFEATNEYHLEFEKLRKARSVKQVTDQ
jgi:hypothetical protein